jgi:tRNA 2-thiouridine synthesizing protein C
LDPKRILIICRKAPYGNSLAREALDIALATSVFEQTLALLFMGDGVWQLMPGQDSMGIPSKNHSKQLSALPLYDVNDIYIDSEALAHRKLTADALILPTQPLASKDIGHFIDSFDTVLSF